MENFNLNMIPSGVSPVCHVSQYDNGRQIKIYLFSGTLPYEIASGDTITVNLRKPDNTIITASVAATQGNDYVILTTTEQMTAVVGETLGEIKITNGSTVIGSLNFVMLVERDVIADGVPSQSVIKDLNALVVAAVGNNYYTKSETDTLLDAKADKSTTYTKTEIDTELSDLQGDIDSLALDVNGVVKKRLTYEQGAYLTNGFSASAIRIRAAIDAGTYIFSPSANIYFAIVYYDTDSAGTAFINMGNISKPTILTLARAAYITIQYKNSQAITPANGDELLVQIYQGEALKDLPELMANRIAEIKNKGNSKDFEHIIGRTAYFVGADKTYTTINAALTAWANDNYPPANVYISNGEYNEVVEVDSKDISFIGESKEGTIIRTTTGKYIDAPIHIKHGNVSVENLTIIADHSSDSNFNYEAETNSSCAYGVHIDGGSVAGKVVVKNCIVVSYQSPAFGLGTIPDSIIRIEDCEAYCYTDYTNNTSSVQYRCLQYGCLLCHMSSAQYYPDRGTETLQLVNSKFYDKNTKNVIKLNYGADLTEHMNVLALNNVLGSDAESDKNKLFVPDAGLVILDQTSQGNTCSTMNYSA